MSNSSLSPPPTVAPDKPSVLRLRILRDLAVQTEETDLGALWRRLCMTCGTSYDSVQIFLCVGRLASEGHLIWTRIPATPTAQAKSTAVITIAGRRLLATYRSSAH